MMQRNTRWAFQTIDDLVRGIKHDVTQKHSLSHNIPRCEGNTGENELPAKNTVPLGVSCKTRTKKHFGKLADNLPENVDINLMSVRYIWSWSQDVA